MSILIETSLGDIVVDLFVDERPLACTNFIKLCKLKQYNSNLFFNVQRDLLIQSGDPTGTGKGGACVWHRIDSKLHPKTYFHADPVSSSHRRRKHDRRGIVSYAMIHVDPMTNQGDIGSQFFVTTADNSEYLDGRAFIFGEIAEGMDVIDKINSVFTDHAGRPLQDVRIKHTIILDDPFPDPPGLIEPERSPSPPVEVLTHVRLGDDEIIDPTTGNEDPEVAEERKRKQEANSRALALEMMGDLPFAEIKPPENVLFVCKLNPVTRDEDLELIFGRFGEINSCEVIRDKATKESLCYAFIEYNEREHCETAYFKMDNVLIDDRRIKVDFSQSVSKLHKDWITSRGGGRMGYGGFANLEKRTQYRSTSSGNVADEEDGAERPKLVFDHDSDLRAGREVSVDATLHQNETMVPPSIRGNDQRPPTQPFPETRLDRDTDRHRSRNSIRSSDSRRRRDYSPGKDDRSSSRHRDRDRVMHRPRYRD